MSDIRQEPEKLSTNSPAMSLRTRLALILKCLAVLLILSAVGILVSIVVEIFFTKHVGYSGLLLGGVVEFGMISIPVIILAGGLLLYLSNTLRSTSTLKSSRFWVATISFIVSIALLAVISAPLYIPYKSSVNDHAYQSMYDNRNQIISALPIDQQASAADVLNFLGGMISHLNKNDAEEIQSVILNFSNEANITPDKERSEKAIESLATIAHRYDHLRSQYLDTYGQH